MTPDDLETLHAALITRPGFEGVARDALEPMPDKGLAHDPGRRQFMRLHAVWVDYQYPSTLDPVTSPPALVGHTHQAAERCFTTLKIGNEDPHQDLWAGARERRRGVHNAQTTSANLHWRCSITRAL